MAMDSPGVRLKASSIYIYNSINEHNSDLVEDISVDTLRLTRILMILRY